MHDKKSYKNIIFDLGGVLIDWRPSDFLKTIFAGQPDALKQFSQALSGNAKDLFEKVGSQANRGAISLDEFEYNFAQALGIDLVHVKSYVQNLPSYLKPIDQGLELVHQAKQAGYKLYILSNFVREWFGPVRKQYDFFNLFDGAIISYEVGQIKPEPEIYHTLLNKYELVAQECLFIDDLPQNIAAGIACGIDGIVCSNLDYVTQELARLGVFEEQEEQTLVVQ